MKAMVWKELRECGTWAVLALALASVANFYGYYMGLPRPDPTQLWDQKIAMSVTCAAMAGALLGAVQILPELRRDQWAFLLHRPMAPAGLFAGKVAAGMLMLSLVICLPDLATYYWLRFRLGHEIVSFWYVLISTFYGLIVATIFYLAAMIAALRPARLFGSRLLSIVTACIVVTALFTLGITPAWWQFLLVAILCIAIIAIAAAGCFVTRGEFRRMTISAQISLALTLLTGAAGVSFIVAVFVGGVIFRGEEFTFVSYRPTVIGNERFISDSHGSIFANNLGQVVHIYRRYVKKPGSHRKGYWQYEGTTIPDGKKIVWLMSNNRLDQFTSGSDVIRVIPAQLLKSRQEISREDRGTVVPRLISFMDGRYTKMFETGGALIYYDEVKKRIVFYSEQERRITGYSGPGGYYRAEETPAADQAYFSAKLLSSPSSRFLWFPNAVFRADEGGRSIKKIIEAGAGKSIESMVPLGAGEAQRLWIVKQDAVEQYDTEGRLLGTTSLEQAEQDSDYVAVIPIPSGKNLLWLANVHTVWRSKPTLHSTVLETTTTGKILRRFELPDLAMEQGTNVTYTALITTIALPFRLIPMEAPLLRRSQDYWVNCIFGFPYISYNRLVPLYIPFCSALLSAAAVWFVALRAGLALPVRLLWTALAIPLGLVAIVVVLSLYAWPVRLVCKRCGKKRNIENESCRHCTAPWPRPERNGTEIFTRDFEVYALGSGGRA